MATYKVTLKDKAFPYELRRRAGIVVRKGEGFEGELTDDQVKAIRADDQLTVKKVSDPQAEAKAKAEAEQKAAEEAEAKAKAEKEKAKNS